MDALLNVQSPLLSLRCSARVRHCLRLLIRVVDWCVSQLVRLTCCRIILTASSPGKLLIWLLTCHPSPSLTSYAYRSSEVRRLLLDLDPYGGTVPLGMFPRFLKRTADVMAPPSERSVSAALFVWLVFRLAGDRLMSPQFRRVHHLLCSQLASDCHNFSIV